MENFQEVLERIYDLVIRYGMKFILAIVVLIVGLIVIRWITRAIVKMMKKGNVNESPDPFPQIAYQYPFESHADHQCDGHGGYSNDLLSLPYWVQPVWLWDWHYRAHFRILPAG